MSQLCQQLLCLHGQEPYRRANDAGRYRTPNFISERILAGVGLHTPLCVTRIATSFGCKKALLVITSLAMPFLEPLNTVTSIGTAIALIYRSLI